MTFEGLAPRGSQRLGPTAEIVIGEIVGGVFKRETDPATTFKELVVE